MNPTPEAFKELAETSKKMLEKYVAAYIDFQGIWLNPLKVELSYFLQVSK